eukprot:6165782-Pleurochrysis_carterae.AAC.4
MDRARFQRRGCEYERPTIYPFIEQLYLSKHASVHNTPSEQGSLSRIARGFRYAALHLGLTCARWRSPPHSLQARVCGPAIKGAHDANANIRFCLLRCAGYFAADSFGCFASPRDDAAE